MLNCEGKKQRPKVDSVLVSEVDSRNQTSGRVVVEDLSPLPDKPAVDSLSAFIK